MKFLCVCVCVCVVCVVFVCCVCVLCLCVVCVLCLCVVCVKKVPCCKSSHKPVQITESNLQLLVIELMQDCSYLITLRRVKVSMISLAADTFSSFITFSFSQAYRENSVYSHCMINDNIVFGSITAPTCFILRK